MRATGLFFLRMNAFVRVDQATRQPIGIALPVVERIKDAEGRWISRNTMLAKWRGPEALAYFDAHRTDLRAGRPLYLELDDLHGREGEWQAYVTRLELAPLAPSWTKCEPEPQHQPQATPA